VGEGSGVDTEVDEESSGVNIDPGCSAARGVHALKRKAINTSVFGNVLRMSIFTSLSHKTKVFNN